MLISEIIEVQISGRPFMFEYIKKLVFRKLERSKLIIRWTEVMLIDIKDCCKMHFSNRRACHQNPNLLLLKESHKDFYVADFYMRMPV